MNLLVIAKLSDYKLSRTLYPLCGIKEIERIILVRRYPLDIPGIECFSPPLWMRSSRMLSELYRIWKINQLCKSNQADMLLGIHYFYHCAYAAYFGKKYNKPYVFSIIEEPQHYADRRKNYSSEQNALAVAVRGNRSKEFLIQEGGVKEDKVLILPDIVDYHPQSDNQENKMYNFVFVGDLVDVKRVDVLIDACKELKNRGHFFKTAIVGQGPLKRSLFQRAVEKGLGQQIEFTGYVKSVFDVLKQSSFLVMTSQSEGLPSVLHEAMSCGLGLIVSDVGDIRDVAIEKENALLVKPLDVTGFADAMEKTLVNKTLNQQYRQKSQELYKENLIKYSSNNVQKVWEKLFNIHKANEAINT